MGYMVTSDKGQLEKIEQLGIPVVINAEYLEEHPLGRAEWIKFAAAFFDKQQEADSIFSFIEDRYIEASTRGKSSDTTPSVLSGVVYGDTWFLPGGQNYASKMIADAGGSYLWADDTTKGFLELGFESVYQKAVNADFWLGVASYTSLEDLKQGDDRYAMLAPYKNKKVFSYNKRIGSEGGNEYFELGYLRPDIILNDLVSILHPNLQQEPLFFFMPLE
jgi:iron complex transport system substrate-binding protein